MENDRLFATLLLGMKSIVFALSKIFFPFELSAVYLQNGPVALSDASLVFAAGFLSLVAILLTHTVYKQSHVILRCEPGVWIRGSLAHARSHLTMTPGEPRRTKLVTRGWSVAERDVVCATLFFLLFYIPSFANFSKMGQVYIFSDRYTYLAMIGILFLVGKGGEWLWDTVASDRFQKWVGSTAVLSILLALTWGARERSTVWRESEVLYRDALSHEGNERSVALHFDLALLMQKQRRVEEALEEYEIVLAIVPSYPKAHNNLGVLFLERGEFMRARAEFGEVLRVEPKNAEALGNLGLLFLEEEMIDEAVNFLERSVEEDPSLAQTFVNLGRAYGKKGMYQEGLEAFQKAFTINPLLEGEARM